jgi:deazaflavin-dependent oxidoreductase (nitroreductase family)
MPIPTAVAKSNRYVVNPIVRRFAGNIAPLALLLHRGRTTGHEYRTPIMAFPDDGGFVIALTYGRNTDWERNVMAAGEGALVYRGKRYAITSPEHIAEERARESLPAVVRIVLPVIGVHDFLHVTSVAQQ